jgi:Tfp pilus assembly protein PilN
MDPENPVAPVAQPQAPQARPKPKADEFIQFKDHGGFNFGALLCWITALLAIVVTLFFWWISKNQKDALATKMSEKDSLVQQLASPTYADIEKRAQEFKSSVAQLKTAYGDKYSYSEFLPQLYTKLTKDTELTSFAITTDGTLSFSGTTTSYRSVADFVVALKSWETLQNVDLTSVSENLDQGKITTLFSVSAKIDKTKQKTAATTTTPATTGSTLNTTNTTSMTGGTDAKI